MPRGPRHGTAAPPLGQSLRLRAAAPLSKPRHCQDGGSRAKVKGRYVPDERDSHESIAEAFFRDLDYRLQISSPAGQQRLPPIERGPLMESRCEIPQR